MAAYTVEYYMLFIGKDYMEENIMAFCSKCGSNVPEGTAFCPNCGTTVGTVGTVNIYDHTAEFSQEEIHDNKLFAILVLFGSFMGIIIALLACKDSDYIKFWVKQEIKVLIAVVLLAILASVLAITIIVPIAAGICIVVLAVCEIIAFFNICGNKVIEIPIVRSLKFLN